MNLADVLVSELILSLCEESIKHSKLTALCRCHCNQHREKNLKSMLLCDNNAGSSENIPNLYCPWLQSNHIMHAATAMLAKVSALEVLLFKWAVILYSHLVPIDLNTSFKSHQEEGLTLAQYQVPTEVTLSVSFLAGQDREHVAKGLWVEIRTGRHHSAITVTGKSDSLGEKLVQLITSQNQSRIMSYKTKS